MSRQFFLSFLGVERYFGPEKNHSTSKDDVQEGKERLFSLVPLPDFFPLLYSHAFF